MTGIYKWGWGDGGKAVAFWGWVVLWSTKGAFVPTFVSGSSVLQVTSGVATGTAVNGDLVPLSAAVTSAGISRFIKDGSATAFSTPGVSIQTQRQKISYGAGRNSLTIDNYRITKSVAVRGQTGIVVKRGSKKVVKR